MNPDPQRISMIRKQLASAKLDGVVCAQPANVLLLTGYCPIVGTSLALANADGHVALIVPQDEEKMASNSRADELYTFEPASLKDMHTAADALKPILSQIGPAMGLTGARIGIEEGAATIPAPYAALHIYAGDMAQLITDSIPRATTHSADDLLAQLRSIKSPDEIERIRIACRLVAEAFEAGAMQLQQGKNEAELASAFRHHLYVIHCETLNEHRADGFVYCMSGPNGAQAYGAYARSRGRIIAVGDLVLTHCNSYVDGFWTDITRTYTLSKPNGRQTSMYDAVFAARKAALNAIRPGAKAADVDRAARDVLTQHGFGDAFKHPTGHGVGFAAINHNALPRLHPASPDVLQTGMVFNVEPGIYIDGYGGMRHCDMVAVSDSGAEVLTPFQASASSLSF